MITPPEPPLAGRRRRSLAALAAPVLACLAAACGSSTAPAHSVATLPPEQHGGQRHAAGTQGEHTPPARTAATRTAAARPVLRLDDSQPRRAALFNAYSSCLLEHGASRATSGMAPAVGVGKDHGILVQQPVPARARAACVSMLPRDPPQLDASTNPRFHAQALSYVGCLQRHGEWVRLLNGRNLDWTFVAGHPVPSGEATIEDRCLLQAFGGR